MSDWYNEDDLAEWDSDDDDGAGDHHLLGEDGNPSEGVPQANAQHVIFLIDCQSFENTMPDPEFPDGKISVVQYGIAAALSTIRSKLRTVTILKYGKRDGIGIILYNTKLRTPLEVKHADDQMRKEDDEEDDEDEPLLFGHVGVQPSRVHELLPLDRPGTQAVQKLNSTQEDVFTGECELDLKSEYGGGDQPPAETSLHLALEMAIQTFQKAPCVKQRPSKREEPDMKHIWILTADANPSGINPSVVESVRENGIDVVVWPIVPDRSSFDAAVYEEKLEIECPREEGEDTIDDLVFALEKLTKKARRVFTAPLVFPGEDNDAANDASKPRMMLDFFSLVRPTVKPKTVPIHNQTGKALAKIIQYVTKDAPEILGEQRYFGDKKRDTAWRQRERSYIEFAGEKVPITESEKAEVKAQGRPRLFPCLVLHGFKQENDVPFHHTMRTSYFCYPNDEGCEGSLDAFVHLHASMINLKVLAIGSFLPPRSSNARYVAIRALPEEVDDDEELIQPPGMLITYLPFEDEKRLVPPDKATSLLQERHRNIASEELVSAATALVQRQTLSGAEIGLQFQNAYTSRLWDYVERLALNEGKKKLQEFDTEINSEQLLKHAGKEITAFGELIPEDVKPEPKSRKRKVAVVIDDSGIDWKEAYVNGELAQFKNADIKKKLQSLGESGSGTKAIMVERLANALEKVYAGETSPTKVKSEADL